LRLSTKNVYVVCGHYLVNRNQVAIFFQ